MKILALEPFYGGSHQAFLDGWQQSSRHDFSSITLPPYKWKWRMRHAAVTFASRLAEVEEHSESWDVLWCSDMLNLAEFLGLAPRSIQRLPRVAYFHENQLTYPVRNESVRDLHFAFSNFTTAIAADEVWFNSEYHRHDFLDALESYLKRMPDFNPMVEFNSIVAKTRVRYPGIETFPNRTSARESGPLRICWNARWEFDKRPGAFFSALRILKSNQVAFELIVLGESFRNSPDVFQSAATEFDTEICHWGFAASKDRYRQLLMSSDVVVSTAAHDFFGIGVVEAVAAGSFPLLPKRLAYPEVLAQFGLADGSDRFLYDGSAKQLASRLTEIARNPDLMEMPSNRTLNRFDWPAQAAAMDDVIDGLLP